MINIIIVNNFCRATEGRMEVEQNELSNIAAAAMSLPKEDKKVSIMVKSFKHKTNTQW